MATMMNSLGQSPIDPMQALAADGEAANAKLEKLQGLGELLTRLPLYSQRHALLRLPFGTDPAV